MFSIDKVTTKVIVGDFAQAADGKLTVVGGGFDRIQGGVPVSFGVGILTTVPWSATNERHSLEVTIVDDDGGPLTDPSGNEVKLKLDFEVGRPPACPAGTAFSVPHALNMNGIVLEENRRYVIGVSVDGAAPADGATASFTATPAQSQRRAS